ncbi:TetR/AcrR family transcriptional regulator [Sphingomonas faeni]|uniref:TetR/AcrR family transcriptional regulator n=1 Tax=Sphingomonas faeni TaxID=185950 RepID=UPI0033580B83
MAEDRTVKQTRRDAILDAAETLFAVHGFDGVSMRMVADAAPVGLGLVTYHFPTKDVLFEEVVARRADILNAARRDSLGALGTATLEQLLHAFFQPYVLLIERAPGNWRAYARLHAMLTQDARWTGLATRHFGSVATDMIKRIMIAEPRLDQPTAARGYVLLIGTMVSVFADTRLVDYFSNGVLTSHDVAGSLDPMVRFGAAGIRALACPTRS